MQWRYISKSFTTHQHAPSFAASLEQWKSSGKRGIWLKLSREQASLIPVAILEHSFEFHHSHPHYVQLVRWLPNVKSTLPHGPTHVVGVGAFVFDEQTQEVLVVKERKGPVTDIWKLPGGRCDIGEEVADAAVREVLEETSVRTRFHSLLCFREFVQAYFGATDLYFVMRLEPLTREIRIQENEIAECKWMPLEEFAALPYYGTTKTTTATKEATGDNNSNDNDNNSEDHIWSRVMKLERLSAQHRYEGMYRELLPSMSVMRDKRSVKNSIFHCKL
jgi:ADP-ribose pyrophosphatase YjhB (NUDIX family)